MRLQTAGVLGLASGQTGSLVDLRMTARWEEIHVSHASLPVVAEKAILALRVVSDAPLELDVKVNVAQARLGDLQAKIGASTLQMRLSESLGEGRLNAVVRLPRDLLTEILHRSIPETVHLDLPAPAYPPLIPAINALAFVRTGFRKLVHAQNPRLQIAVSGHNNLQLHTEGDSLLLVGRLGITLVGLADVEDLMVAVKGLIKPSLETETGGDIPNESTELVRFDFDLPIDHRLKINTQTASSLRDLKVELVSRSGTKAKGLIQRFRTPDLG
jgi:hypothetical protein